MPIVGERTLHGHMGQCFANPSNQRKLRRITPKETCVSRDCSHLHTQDRFSDRGADELNETTDELQEDINEDRTILDRGNDGMNETTDELQEDGAEEKTSRGTPTDLSHCSAHEQQNKGNVEKYMTSQKDGDLGRRISKLVLHETEFSPEDRDEIKLLDIVLKYNMPKGAYDDIAKWSDERASSNTRLKRYDALEPTILQNYTDISFMKEIEVPKARKNIEEDSEDEEDEAQESSTIKRNIVCNDIIKVSLELFERMNPKLVHFEESETLQYLYQGEWWRDTELKYCYEGGSLVRNKYLFPIIPFLDGVLAANGGKLSIEPVLVTLGLFDAVELSKEGYREYVASLEKGLASKAEKINISDVELDIFHRSLEVVFSPIRECTEQGGFKYMVDGIEVILVPVIPFIVQDTDEGNRLAGVFNNWSVEKPCRLCEVSFENCDDPNCNAHLRKQSEQRELIETCTKIIGERAYGTVTGAREKLKKKSLKPVLNAFWDLPCGGTEENGIYLACFPEKLHQLEGGLMKIFMQAFREFFKSQYPARNGVTAALQKLDRRARNLARFLSRQSDRSVPAKRFSKGVTDITGLRSQEFPPLVLLLVCTIGNDETIILNRSARKRWVSAGWQLLVVWSWLKQEKYEKSELPYLQLAVVKMLDLFKLCAEDWIPSGCKFPKFHLSLHYVQFIKLFGPPLLCYGGYWERSLKHHVKKAFQRTSKNNATAPEELRERHRFLSAFFLKHRQMTEFEVKFCGVAQPTPIEHNRGSRVQLSGTHLNLENALPEVWEHVTTSFEDIYNYTGPLLFRTELRLRLGGESNFTIFRADPAYKRKSPWFDWAIIQCSESADPEVAQIFGFISSPDDVDDVLMICSVLAYTGMGDVVQLKQYKRVHKGGSSREDQKLKYRILPVSYITKTAFVSPNLDSTQFTLIPPRYSWAEEITPSSALAPLHLHTRLTDPQYSVRSILKKKVIQKRGRRGVRSIGTMYLVEWENYHKCQSSWVKKSNVGLHWVNEYEARKG